MNREHWSRWMDYYISLWRWLKKKIGIVVHACTFWNIRVELKAKGKNLFHCRQYETEIDDFSYFIYAKQCKYLNQTLNKNESNKKNSHFRFVSDEQIVFRCPHMAYTSYWINIKRHSNHFNLNIWKFLLTASHALNQNHFWTRFLIVDRK